MKTVMQELIEEIKNEILTDPNETSLISCFKVIKMAEAKLEKEKEQIIEFGYKCRNKCKKVSTLLPQDIFNTTYNQNK